MENQVLALYNFEIKESNVCTDCAEQIFADSDFLNVLFRRMCSSSGITYDLKHDFCLESFIGSGIPGEVILDENRDFVVIYKSFCDYVESNKKISEMMIENGDAFSVTASHVNVSGNFVTDYRNLYLENRCRKSEYIFKNSDCVTPFTAIDSSSFVPLVQKNPGQTKIQNLRNSYVPESLKRKQLDCLVTKKGEESLLAVIYIKGNNSRSFFETCVTDFNYDSGIKELRNHFFKICSIFTEKPLYLFEEKMPGDASKLKKVFSSENEMTLVCNAGLAWKFVEFYFNLLESSGLSEYTACAGISVFHRQTSFSEACRVAKECYESARSKSAKESGASKNCIDFQYCYSGITGNLEAMRIGEKLTYRPYVFKEAEDMFSECAEILHVIGRSNAKGIVSAATESIDKYRFEVNRINAYAGQQLLSPDDKDMMKILCDMGRFYDIWFRGSD